ncbi:hypothetical protein EGW08_022776, partial [Elysia chlorotica]
AGGGTSRGQKAESKNYYIVGLIIYVGGFKGWGRHFKSVSNSLPGILVGILMFALPSSMSCIRPCSGETQPEKLDVSSEKKENAVDAVADAAGDEGLRAGVWVQSVQWSLRRVLLWVVKRLVRAKDSAPEV